MWSHTPGRLRDGTRVTIASLDQLPPPSRGTPTERPPLRALVRAFGRWLAFAASSYALVQAGSCAADWLWSGRAAQAGTWVFAVGVGAGAGALAGFELGLGLGLIAQLRPRGRAIAWALAGCALFAWCVHELGVIERLGGAYARLGWIALAGIGAFAPGASALGHAITPGAGLQLNRSWLASRALPARAALIAALALAGLSLLVLDHVVLAGGYPFIHRMLERGAQLLSWAAVTHALIGRDRGPGMASRARALAIPVAAALALLPLAVLDRTQGAVLGALRSSPLCEQALSDLAELGDLDADGYAPWLGGGDCAPLDAAVHPGAPELPGNGIDDNCRLGDRPARPSPVPRVEWANAPQPWPSVVLITVDTLRADHVGAYGYPRATTPHIDAWFGRGTRFADAISPGAYTTVTMPALMRGVHARALRWSVALQTDRLRLVRSAGDARLAPGERWTSAQLIGDDERIPTLAERLRGQGYRTAAVVDDGGSSFLAPEIMGRGFERYVYVPAQSRALFDPEGDAKVAEQALRVLAALRTAPDANARPFFLWLHFFGVHGPDARHADAPVFGGSIADGYDHEIASVDLRLGRVLAELDTVERQQPLLTVLTSDHGERIYPTGRAHGSNLGEDEIRVPLLMRGYGVAREVVREPVSLLDVVPSVLVRCGARAIAGFDGLDALSAAARSKRQVVLSDVWRYDARGRIEFDRVAAVARTQRLVFEPSSNAQRSFARGRKGARPVPPDRALERAVYEYLERAPPQPHVLMP